MKGLIIRLYPTEKQKKILENHFNITRCIYNLALETKIRCYQDYQVNLSRYDLQNQLPELKHNFPWIKDCKAECLQYTLLQLDNAYKRFFKLKKGFPKFKSKYSKQSFTQNQHLIIDDTGILFLGNKIKFKTSSEYQNLLKNIKIKKITYSKNNLGEYYASILIDFNHIQLPKIKNESASGIFVLFLTFTYNHI